MLTGPFKQTGVASIETAVKNIYYDLYGGKPLSHSEQDKTVPSFQL